MSMWGQVDECRICMLSRNENPNLKFVNIFTVDSGNLIFADFLMACLPVQISKNDGLPDTICFNCNEKLKILQELRTTAILSDNTLRKKIITNSIRDITKAKKIDYRRSTSVPFESTSSDFNKLSLPSKSEKIECSYCNDIFESKVDLNFHLTAHDRKLFECIVCNKRFKNQFNFFQHNENVHQDNSTHQLIAPPFGCVWCGMIFESESELSSHLNLLVKDGDTKNPYACCTCKILFNVREEYLSHSSKFHFDTGSDWSHICDVCGDTFRNDIDKHAHSAYHKFIPFDAGHSEHPNISLNATSSTSLQNEQKQSNLDAKSGNENTGRIFCKSCVSISSRFQRKKRHLSECLKHNITLRKSNRLAAKRLK